MVTVASIRLTGSMKTDILFNLPLYALGGSSGIRGKRNPSKNKLEGSQKVFICNGEGHRQIQFKANELCRECPSILSRTFFAFFLSSQFSASMQR